MNRIGHLKAIVCLLLGHNLKAYVDVPNLGLRAAYCSRCGQAIPTIGRLGRR